MCFVRKTEVGQSEKEGWGTNAVVLYLAGELLFPGWGEMGKVDGLPSWAFWVNLSKVHNCSVMQILIRMHQTPHPPTPVQCICIYSTVCVCVSSSLTILSPRNVRQLMAGTHHIVMIIIQELTLSVCDLLLTPVQYYYHPLRSLRFCGLAPLYVFSVI